MSLSQIHKVLKKYRELHKKHIDSWKDAQERIRVASKKVQDEMNDPQHIFTCYKTYRKESYNHLLNGNKLLDAMMKELDGLSVFPKKIKKNHKNIN